MPRKTTLVKVGKKRFDVTAKEAEVVAALKRTKKWIGPTDVGISCGQEYGLASAWASPALKKLVERGVVVKSETERGKYQLAR